MLDEAEQIQKQELGALSKSPTQLQDLQTLDHSQLLSLAIGRELDGK